MTNVKKLNTKIEKEKRKLKEAMQKAKEKEKELKRQQELKKQEDELKIKQKEIKFQRSKFSLEGIKDHFRKQKPEDLVIINMELRNGMHKTFYVAESGASFKWNKRRYIFDPMLKYFNISFKEYCYDYHEDFDLPFKREFPLNDTKEAIESSGLTESEFATNPSTLERFMNSAIIEMMLRGGSIDKILKIIMIVMAFALVVGLIHLILYMYQSGLFSNMGI